jgi:hypothetical protein
VDSTSSGFNKQAIAAGGLRGNIKAWAPFFIELRTSKPSVIHRLPAASIKQMIFLFSFFSACSQPSNPSSKPFVASNHHLRKANDVFA